MILLFEVDGLSAERQTEIRTNLAKVVEGEVGTIGAARTGFGVADASLIVDTISALLSAAALILQLRSRSSSSDASKISEEVSTATGVALTEAELTAVGEALDAGRGTVRSRGVSISIRVNDNVLEARCSAERRSG